MRNPMSVGRGGLQPSTRPRIRLIMQLHDNTCEAVLQLKAAARLMGVCTAFKLYTRLHVWVIWLSEFTCNVPGRKTTLWEAPRGCFRMPVKLWKLALMNQCSPQATRKMPGSTWPIQLPPCAGQVSPEHRYAVCACWACSMAIQRPCLLPNVLSLKVRMQ